MIVLAIDPGVEKVGFSIFNKKDQTKALTYIISGLIRTKKTLSHEKRLLHIFDELKDIVKKHKPDILVMEQLFFFKNQKTVIGVSQAQGAILLLAAQNMLDVTYLTPLQIKQIITGYGNADKKSVEKMIRLTVKINKPIKEDDEFDAIACGLAYCYLNKKLIQ